MYAGNEFDSEMVQGEGRSLECDVTIDAAQISEQAKQWLTHEIIRWVNVTLKSDPFLGEEPLVYGTDFRYHGIERITDVGIMFFDADDPGLSQGRFFRRYFIPWSHIAGLWIETAT